MNSTTKAEIIIIVSPSTTYDSSCKSITQESHTLEKISINRREVGAFAL